MKEEERSSGVLLSALWQGAARETLGAFPPATGGAAGAGGGVCSLSCWRSGSKVPASRTEVAQTARRRWACEGVSRVWAPGPVGRGSVGKRPSRVALGACLNPQCEWSWKRLLVVSVLVWVSFIILCLHLWNLFVFEMSHVFSYWPASSPGDWKGLRAVWVEGTASFSSPQSWPLGYTLSGSDIPWICSSCQDIEQTCFSVKCWSSLKWLMSPNLQKGGGRKERLV